MNGAERLLETLVESGVELCFANPGTSEMQLVSAIGNSEKMRAVLCLFEGVVSGAADGYARMSDKPALTLLHLGSGFSNSMANQHNAKRAHVPLLNIVGDHATYHLQYDSPLTSDVPAHARICSDWTRVSESADDLAASGAQANPPRRRLPCPFPNRKKYPTHPFLKSLAPCPTAKPRLSSWAATLYARNVSTPPAVLPVPATPVFFVKRFRPACNGAPGGCRSNACPILRNRPWNT
jgi:hypothetical protein